MKLVNWLCLTVMVRNLQIRDVFASAFIEAVNEPELSLLGVLNCAIEKMGIEILAKWRDSIWRDS